MDCDHPSAKNVDLEGKQMRCHQCGADVPTDEYCGVCGTRIHKGRKICENCQKGFR